MRDKKVKASLLKYNAKSLEFIIDNLKNNHLPIRRKYNQARKKLQESYKIAYADQLRLTIKIDGDLRVIYLEMEKFEDNLKLNMGATYYNELREEVIDKCKHMFTEEIQAEPLHIEVEFDLVAKIILE